jgi:hypothetical protein
MKTKTTKTSTRHAATPIALDGSELDAVSGGIWGGPDGTWRCDGTRVLRRGKVIIA